MSKLRKAVLIVGVAVFLFIVFVLCVVFIYSLPRIDVDITGPAEMQLSELGKPITYTISISNTGNRDLFNVSVSDSYDFNWTGSLAIGENKTFFLEYKGSIRDDIVNEVHVDGYTEKGLHVWSQDSWTLAVVGGSYDLVDAINDDLIDAEFRGTGYCSGNSIESKITSKLNVSIEIEITPGLVLINSGSGARAVSEQKKKTVA